MQVSVVGLPWNPAVHVTLQVAPLYRFEQSEASTPAPVGRPVVQSTATVVVVAVVLPHAGGAPTKPAAAEVHVNVAAAPV